MHTTEVKTNGATTHFSLFNIFEQIDGFFFFSEFRVHFFIHILIPAFAVSVYSLFRLFVFFDVALFTATFTCVVNNLGGYRVSADTAPARVCIFYLS